MLDICVIYDTDVGVNYKHFVHVVVNDDVDNKVV